MNRIAIIPARSGSKGLKDKNIIELCGKPLMAYSIEAALKSRLFHRVIVSTDSESYAAIARQYGAEVMMRGEELSNDSAATYVVVEDVIHRLGSQIDFFVLLQPTSPLRNEQHIADAVDFFEKNMSQFDFLVSVKEAEHGAVLVKPIEDDLSLKHFDADFANYRRQKYKEYSPNGAIFIAKPKEYMEKKHFFGERSLAYIMEKRISVDIDDKIDLMTAKNIMESDTLSGSI